MRKVSVFAASLVLLSLSVAPSGTAVSPVPTSVTCEIVGWWAPTPSPTSNAVAVRGAYLDYGTTPCAGTSVGRHIDTYADPCPPGVPSAPSSVDGAYCGVTNAVPGSVACTWRIVSPAPGYYYALHVGLDENYDGVIRWADGERLTETLLPGFTVTPAYPDGWNGGTANFGFFGHMTGAILAFPHATRTSSATPVSDALALATTYVIDCS